MNECCDSHIARCDTIQMVDGLDMHVYTCGECGAQLEVTYDADPTKH